METKKGPWTRKNKAQQHVREAFDPFPLPAPPRGVLKQLDKNRTPPRETSGPEAGAVRWETYSDRPEDQSTQGCAGGNAQGREER